MKNLKLRVERLLQERPELRDSDKALMAEVWKNEGLWLDEGQIRKFMQTTPAESISRVRRSLRGKYPASPKIEAQRYQLFKENLDKYSRAPNWWIKKYNYED